MMNILKTILLAAICVAGSNGAQAQTSRAFNWTGVYMGAYGGLAAPSGTYSLGGLSAVVNGTGFAGGGQLGFNSQWDNIVLGVEGDIGLNTARRDYNNIIFVGDNLRATMPMLATVRARAGYAINRLLVYGTGGLALGNPTMTYSVGALSLSTGTTKAGWTIGAGLEYAITDNWTAKLEYGYLNLGTDVNWAIAGDRWTYEAHSVKFGVNYLFR